jgi:hypothetical protein
MPGIIGFDCIVRFRETRIETRGSQSPQLIGEYLGIISDTKMVGIYHSKGEKKGQFYLQRIS